VAGGVQGFSPLELSPALWLDASDTSTITASGGLVSAWADKSGNSRNMSQSTSSVQPSYTDTKNGLSVVTFGDTKRMFGSVWGPSTSAITIAAVIRSTTSSSQRVAFSLGSNNHMAVSTNTQYGKKVGGLIGGVEWLETSTSANQSWTVLVVRRASSTNTVRANGSNLTVTLGGSSTPVSASGNMWVGGDSVTPYGNWQVAEIVVVNGSSLSGSSLTNLETYLNAKWAVY
jgi:hypothetical protein